MEIIKREDQHLGGFAGLKEHRLVMDAQVFGRGESGPLSKAIGNFVYLADATFQPLGDTKMHPHKEVDIITFMVKGRLHHEGSLGAGTMLMEHDIQIQRAGAKGLVHNEINPDEEWNRMLQLWVLPDQEGMATDYQVVKSKKGELTPVYGGENKTLKAKTQVKVAYFEDQMEVKQQGEFVAYMIQGAGLVNGQEVTEGDLIKGSEFKFIGQGEGQLFLVQYQE